MPEFFISKNDFIFLKSDGNNYLKHLTGEVECDKSTIDEIVAAHAEYQKLLAANNIQYKWIIVPTKERILIEELNTPSITNNLPINKLKQSIKINSPELADHFLDLGEINELFYGYSASSLFHKYDTHWTHNLAFRSYHYIMDRFLKGIYGKSIDIAISKADKQIGDMASAFNKPSEDIFFHHPLNRPTKIWSNEALNNGRINLIKGFGQKNAIILHSSSFDYMGEFFTSHFAKSLTIFTPNLPKKLTLEKPDIIFSITQERYLTRPPKICETTAEVKYFNEDQRPKSQELTNKYLVENNCFLGKSTIQTVEAFQ